MEIENIVLAADQFAEEKHRGQTDRAGEPYINHPRALVTMVESDDERVVALLHDTVEDTSATVDEIREIFGERVAEAVDCLTRKPNVPYMDYIKKVSGNGLARVVKIADLKHNMDTSRLPEVTEADLERLEKYQMAYQFLTGEVWK